MAVFHPSPVLWLFITATLWKHRAGYFWEIPLTPLSPSVQGDKEVHTPCPPPPRPPTLSPPPPVGAVCLLADMPGLTEHQQDFLESQGVKVCGGS